MKKALTVLCFVFIFSCCASAVGAITPIDTDRPSSLTLYYTSGGNGIEGLTVSTYRIAEVYSDGTYALTGDFATYPVNIYDVMSQTEWRTIASTLAAYAVADGLIPYRVGITDENGRVSFTDIMPGMYLTLSVNHVTDEQITVFETFLTVVPYPNDNGAHDYDVEAYPKSQTHTPTPEKVTYKVIKLWQDANHTQARPHSVTVEIYNNGQLKLTEELSSENDWTFTWEAPDDGSHWYVTEKTVPEGYAVTVTERGNTFIVTNSYRSDDEPDTPGTSDSYTPIFFALATCSILCGAMILTSRPKRTK